VGIAMRDSTPQPLGIHYALALADFLESDNKESFRRAQELGKLATKSGILPHQLVYIHAHALRSITSSVKPSETAFHLEFLAQATFALAQQSAEDPSPAGNCSRCLDVQYPVGTDTSRSIAADTRQRREFLVALSRRVLTSTDPRAAVRGVVDEVVPETADCAAIHWVDSQGQLILAARATSNPRCEDSQCQKLAREALGSCKVKFLERPVSCNRVHQAVVIPLVAHGQALGTLSLCQASDSRNIDFVREFGEQMACCTQRALESAQYRAAALNSYVFLDEYLNSALHDLSSPLGTLSLVLEIGLERLQKGDTLNERTLRKALAQVEQMTVLMKELLEATRETLTRSTLPPAPEVPVQPVLTD
jgi:hypothetical protein